MSSARLRALVVIVLLAGVVTVSYAQNPITGAPSAEIYGGDVPRVIREWSRELQTTIAALSRRVRDGDVLAAGFAFLAAIVFGMVHIAGPGHGKVFAISYFSGRDARPRDGLLYSAIVNAIDSLSALVLVLLGYVLLRAVVPGFRETGPRVLELVSYSVIVIFGVAHLIGHLRPHSHDDAAQERSRSRPPWVLALSVGLVPCPVSTILLVYGIANGVLPFMGLMVVGVSIGGFVVMAGLSVAVIAGRSRLLDRLHGRAALRVGTALELVASGAIIVVGVLLLLARL